MFHRIPQSLTYIYIRVFIYIYILKYIYIYIYIYIPLPGGLFDVGGALSKPYAREQI